MDHRITIRQLLQLQLYLHRNSHTLKLTNATSTGRHPLMSGPVVTLDTFGKIQLIIVKSNPLSSNDAKFRSFYHDIIFILIEK